MPASIRLLSTDFDGTIHTDHEDPPVPRRLHEVIARMQSEGVTWVINTGRDLSSLMETLGRAQLSIWPDYVVTVEREIYRREHGQYVGFDEWNRECTRAHQRLFARVRQDVPALFDWIKARFEATLYEDAYSPFCLIARSAGDAGAILHYLESYCATVPDLAVVCNDVYARFSHTAFNKGTALGEIMRALDIAAEEVVAAGDHLNDLPMLSTRYAKWLIAPGNAIAVVKETVLRQRGRVAEEPHGHGVVRVLEELQRDLACGDWLT